MSSGAQIVTYITPETTPGETPATPEWDTLRLTGNTLSPNVSTEQSNEIRPERMGGGSIITSLDYSGDLNFEMSADSFDDLLEAAFYGEWTTDALEIGSTRHTFTVVKGYQDVNVWTTFKGVHVGAMTLEIPEEGVVTGSFSLMGLGYEDGNTNPTSTGTVNAATTTVPMGSATSVGDVQIDGSSLAGDACISAMSLNIDNTMQTQRCLGKAGPGALIATRANVTGSVTLAWSADSFEIWKKMLTREAVSLTFPLTDGTTTYTIEIPAAELDGELPDGGVEDIIQVELSLTAKNSPVKITRSTNP